MLIIRWLGTIIVMWPFETTCTTQTVQSILVVLNSTKRLQLFVFIYLFVIYFFLFFFSVQQSWLCLLAWKSKIFTIWPFTEKACQRLLRGGVIPNTRSHLRLSQRCKPTQSELGAAQSSCFKQTLQMILRQAKLWKWLL